MKVIEPVSCRKTVDGVKPRGRLLPGSRTECTKIRNPIGHDWLPQRPQNSASTAGGRRTAARGQPLDYAPELRQAGESSAASATQDAFVVVWNLGIDDRWAVAVWTGKLFEHRSLREKSGRLSCCNAVTRCDNDCSTVAKPKKIAPSRAP